MHRIIVIALFVIVALGAFVYASAQGTPEAAPAGEKICATPVAASPVAASPVSDEIGSPVAADEGCPTQAAPSHVIELIDIAFRPDELTIPAGQDVEIELPNAGGSFHNFSISEFDVDIDLAPGDTEIIVINAKAGEYKFFCDIPGHEAAGMVGTLTVD